MAATTTISAASLRAGLERLLQAPEIDWQEAAELVSEIARDSSELALRQAAGQALSIVRAAAMSLADHATQEAARRRLLVVLDVLVELTAPRFGRRGIQPKPLSPDQRARKLLGLPIDGPLSSAEIRGAFRRAAKLMHPDTGGSAEAFRELAAAQDALMKAR
ncbi:MULTISPECIES: J domain-containing protein [unclassified Bradyrhizobium]|uniref:J domain-containing protein n=1 Tax=unclassified Bradyrhizobium TaxID=2631580 RepID=UPI0028EFBC8C|nr:MULTISPECIES: J domain-containing protein [unclassified Bradyrhizobium]